MILLIDNYDSFVHNLARYFVQLGAPTRVVRNDAFSLEDIRRWAPQAIVLSPGPCTPDEAGLSLAVVEEFHKTVPMLGVCLGHQAIAQALGGEVVRSRTPCHGIASRITHLGEGIFAGLPAEFEVGRYHSLVVQEGTLPECLEPTAWTTEGVLMAITHRQLPLVGLQFHPESILTSHGYHLLANFLAMAGVAVTQSPATLAASLLTKSESSFVLPSRPVTF